MRWTLPTAMAAVRGIGCACAAAMCFASASPSWAATTAQVDNARTKGLAWLFQNQKGDGSWSAATGLQVQATSAALNAFLNAGIQNGDAYYAGIAHLANAHPASIDGQARQLATLLRTGSDVGQFAIQLQSARNVYFGWGSLPSHSSTPADTGLALSAMLDAVPSYANADILSGLCNAVLMTQRSGGGWSYQGLGGNVPATAAGAAIIPTADAVRALQKASLRLASGTCSNGTTYTFANVMAAGITFLKTRQNADGGFGESGTSGPLETALAYQAIYIVNGADTTLAPAQDYLVLTAQQTNGSWGNDPFQTALVLETFPSVVLPNAARDGVPDAVKTVLGLNPAVVSRGLLPGNGLAVPGVNAPIQLPGGTLGQAYSHTLAGSGGTAPYSFRRVSGFLPDGLSLGTNGVIAGAPGVVGPFSFTYETTDSQGATAQIEAQIAVSNVVLDAADVPTLPEWATLILGLVLLASAWRNKRQA